MNSKKWKIALYILAFFPAVFVVAMLSFYADACLSSGHLNFSHIDPKDFTEYGVYQFIIMGSYQMALFCFPLWLVLVAIQLALSRNKRIDWKTIGYTGGLFSIGFLLSLSAIMNYATY